MQLNINAHWILGADTLISLDDAIYGKPADRESASIMLKQFSGKTHEVITGITLFDSQNKFISSRTSISKVSFMDLADDQIEQYLNSGEWQGVAGGYRIQGLGAFYITRIEGSYSGIVGLPIHELYAILREHGYVFPD
jgi:septum formation protein